MPWLTEAWRPVHQGPVMSEEWDGSHRKNRRLISILLACQDRKRGMTDKAKLFCHALLWGEFLRDSAIARVRAPTHSGIPVAKSTGQPDRRYSTDGRHGGTAAENAQAPAPLISEMTQGNRRSARLAKTGDPLQGQHTNADSGASTTPEMIGRHGGPLNKAGATNNQTTRLSTAQGCVATDTHCVSLNGAALQGTPSSHPTPVTAPNNLMPAVNRSDCGIDFPGHHR